jgi:hypothetical protein
MKSIRGSNLMQSRFNERLNKVIETAILHRSFTEEEMLKKGIEFIVFTLNYRKGIKVKVGLYWKQLKKWL